MKGGSCPNPSSSGAAPKALAQVLGPSEDRFRPPDLKGLAEVDLYGLPARFIRDKNLFWHIFCLLFIFLFLSIPNSRAELRAPGSRVDN